MDSEKISSAVFSSDSFESADSVADSAKSGRSKFNVSNVLSAGAFAVSSIALSSGMPEISSVGFSPTSGRFKSSSKLGSSLSAPSEKSGSISSNGDFSSVAVSAALDSEKISSAVFSSGSFVGISVLPIGASLVSSISGISYSAFSEMSFSASALFAIASERRSEFFSEGVASFFSICFAIIFAKSPPPAATAATAPATLAADALLFSADFSRGLSLSKSTVSGMSKSSSSIFTS